MKGHEIKIAVPERFQLLYLLPESTMARLDRTFGNLYTLLKWPFRQLSEPKVNLGNVLM